METSNNPLQEAESRASRRVAVPVDRAYWTCYNFTKFANGQID